MKPITVYDNFISDEELEEVYQFIHKRYPDHEYSFNWCFNTIDNCWKKTLYDVTKYKFPCTLIKNFIFKMKNRIEKHTKINFKIAYVYLNRQNYGEDVPMHTDTNRSDGYTFLLYLGDITPENFDKAGGILEFEDDKNTKIEPFIKRAVLFKSYIPHRPFAPLIPGITRISLAIKFVDSSVILPFTVRYS
jgi:hypothetical protein